MTITATTQLSVPPGGQSSSQPRPHRPNYRFRPANVTELIGVFKIQRQQWDDIKLIQLEDGTTVKVSDDDNELRCDMTYRFHGRWVTHPKYGRQFQADTFTSDTPLNETGIIAYLSITCDNIGKATARKLWQQFGPSAVEVVRDTPEKVVAAGILDASKAQEASDCLKYDTGTQRTKIELLGMFKGHGFGKRVITECVHIWGARAAEVVRRDPFTLMVNEIVSCGFKRCDGLYLHLGLSSKRRKRQMLSGWYDLHSDSTGHTWFPIGKVNKINPKAIELGVRARWLVEKVDDNGKVWITERKKAEAEQAVAYHLARLMAWRPMVGDQNKLLWPSAEAIEGLSEHQEAMLSQALREPVSILCGSPGTGKTHTAARLIKAIISQHGPNNVSVCAPTGKAAVRVQENLSLAGVNLKASTIHRLLKITPDSANTDELPKLPAKFVVIDEMSMADTNLLSIMLSVLSTGTHVLFIGDPYQLPPVGHGAPLRDMIESGVVPVGELTEIRRNAGKIVEACKAIKDGKRFEVIDKYNSETGDNLRCVESLSTDDTSAGVCKLHEVLPRYKFDPVWDTQVLVAMNTTGPLSRGPLNRLLQNQLNRYGYRVEGNQFRVGDKLIGLKNCQMKLVKFGNGRPESAESYINCIDGIDKKSEDFVANGEIGRVLAVGQKQTIARFEAPTRVVRILHGAQSEQKEDDDKDTTVAQFDLAYAVTCHKCQGSESPVVIVVLDPLAKMVCTREWTYTAISRAKKLCILVGPRKLADEYCRRVSLDKRKTFLKELLGAMNGTTTKTMGQAST